MANRKRQKSTESSPVDTFSISNAVFFILLPRQLAHSGLRIELRRVLIKPYGKRFILFEHKRFELECERHGSFTPLGYVLTYLCLSVLLE